MLHKLCDYIRAHGISAHVSGRKLYAMNVYSLPNGETHHEWVRIRGTFRAVREWLGY